MLIGSSANLRSGLFATAAIGAVAIAGAAWAQTKTFDVPAQPAATGVAALARQADVQILISAADAAGKRVNAVHGSYSAPQALGLLLAGTGLEARMTGPQTYTVVRQAPSEAETAAPTPSAIDEVIVTAQKRSEDLQTVPISAQVYSGRAIAERNIASLEDLSQTTPGLFVAPDGSGAAHIFIRGIGTDAPNATLDQSVAVFVDDIYKGRSLENFTGFLDLDHVEVLKGPQSTFFGNSAIAGALNLVTANPGDRWSGSARLSYGSYNAYEAEGAVGGPVSDTLGVRLAATVGGNDGWITNLANDKKPVTQNQAARLTLVYKPSSDFDLTFKLSGGKHNNVGGFTEYPPQLVNCPPPLSVAVSTACSKALSLGNIPMGLDNDKATWIPGEYSKLSVIDSSLTANYHFGRGLTLTSVTGFSTYHYGSVQNAAPVPDFDELGTYFGFEHYSQLSQEFRIASPIGQRVEYLLGAYFQDDHFSENGGGPVPYLNFVAPPQYQTVDAIVGGTQTERIYSAFGSIGWNISDKLKLTAGLRAERVQKVGDLLGFQLGYTHQVFGGYTFIPWQQSQLETAQIGLDGAIAQPHYDVWESAATPSVDLQYKLKPEAMVYLKYANGFKAGGVNQVNDFNSVPDSFEPERVNAFEVGLKSKWLDNRLQFNIDLFLEDYKNLQVQALKFAPGLNQYINFLENAAGSRSQGVELETDWVALRDLRLSVNLSYLDAHYTNFQGAQPNTYQQEAGQVTQDLSGRPTDFAPQWSGSVSASYSHAMANGFRLTATVSPYFATSYYASNGNDDPLHKIPGHTRLDGKLTLESPGGRWAFDIIGKNLTDAVIPVSFDQQGLDGAAKEEPLNIAGQLRLKW